MPYTALYREWRPKTFSDVVGQKHITTTLKNQIMHNRIAHAYLFCGTRGTGKTSTAKILAKAINCLSPKDGEPCNECEMCQKINKGLAIDVTELDAASNNGIDKIRDIIEDSKYVPQEAKYKVYIMDEVHMLSIGAVNAFLKTLEEPPEKVVFILATTDPQKLPVTILSRCQRYDFKRISNTDISDNLRKIVDAKGVLADDKSLNLIARTSDGAMRDSHSILDQAIAMGDGKVDYDQLISMLGLVTNESLFSLTEAIIKKDIETCMNTIENAVISGKDMYLFIKDITFHFRNLLMSKVTNNPEEVLDMSIENIKLIKEQGQRLRVEEIMRDIRILQEAENSAKISKDSRIYLELGVIKMCKIEYDTSSEVIISRINRLENALKSGKISVSTTTQSADAPKKEIQKIKKEVVLENPEKIITSSKVKLEDVKRNWKDILERFKERRYMIIYALLYSGKVARCEKGIITVIYSNEYSHNKERLEKSEFSQVVDSVFSEVLGEPVKVRYYAEKEENRQPEDILKDKLGESGVDVIDG